jgi:ketosteroid isomerase-like protein
MHVSEQAPADRSHPAFRENAEPFYRIVREGLGDLVDGEHFWDAVAEDAVFEFRYLFPGFGPLIKGRRAYMDWFAGYDMQIHTADGLRVSRDLDQGIITIEYEVHGTTASGHRYDNRFCSVVTVRDRSIVHWRDYMDSLAVVNALGAN